MGLPSMQHHPHHQQGPAPPHLTRPASIVHQPYHQAPQSQQQQHSSGHSNHSVYQQQAQGSNAQHAQDIPYYPAHPSPYSTPGANSGYPSAEASDMMATTIPRYPPMQYHTPQSNSPASVASPSGHDQQRGMYAQHQQSMYYPPPQQTPYSSMPAPNAGSAYAQHAPQSHQPMTSQPNMMMSHQSAQHQMGQHAGQHAQAGMTGSPRHTKLEPHNMPSQLQRTAAPTPLAQSQNTQNGAPLSTPTGSAAGVNPNAAPGPIPATTPLVVRQDNNGVQWIAFEYSRDRVKMEYTIRCDVESVNTDELSGEFKTENCVYPRACCPKDQYRGNRLQYETECNTVGWALAQLNPPLRGKRGLIQRAVDSWRNSNQDPRLRSRRVRRMAKMNTRKSSTPHPAHLGGPAGPHMPTSSMGPGGAPAMGKPVMNSMGPMHHHHAGHQDGSAQGGGDEVDEYDDSQHHHHHQQQSADERPTQAFTGYGQYPGDAPPPHTAASANMSSSGGSNYPDVHLNGRNGPIAAYASSSSNHGRNNSRDDARHDEPDDLFPDIPEAKKRKFILVDDSDRQSRLRVRVTLDGVDTREIPDSFRKGSSVYPRSYFPREMQSPPPSATGSKFFTDDFDEEDDGAADTEGRKSGGPRSGAKSRGGNSTALVKVPVGEGQEVEVAVPRMRRSARGKEVRLNDLGYRMAWLQSRVFAGRTVFLQRALDCYRNKTKTAIEGMMQDVREAAPHFETRVGKRRWTERMKRGEKKDDE